VNAMNFDLYSLSGQAGGRAAPDGLAPNQAAHRH